MLVSIYVCRREYPVEMSETETRLSRCVGMTTVSTRVDGEMEEYLRGRADRAGVSVSELVRRLFDALEASERGSIRCDHCGEAVDLADHTEL